MSEHDNFLELINPDRADFYAAVAFRKACFREGVPLDRQISPEVLRLAELAWHASCSFSRQWCHRYRPDLATGPCRDDAERLWQQARDALAA